MTLEEKKVVYGMITTIWKMLSRYDSELTDEQWEALLEEARGLEVSVYTDAPYNRMFRDLFLIVTKYHEGLYREEKKQC